MNDDIKDAIAALWRHYRDSGQLRNDIDALEPEARTALMARLAQYVSPKMKSVDMDVSQHTTITIEERLRQLMGD